MAFRLLWVHVRSASVLSLFDIIDTQIGSAAMNMRIIVCGLILLTSEASFAQQTPISSAPVEKPLPPLPASADIEPGSEASANAPTAYALPAETFHIWAGKNKAFQVAVAQLAMKKAKTAETRNYAAQLFNAYANGYAKLHNIPETPSGDPATLTDAQLSMLALLKNARDDFDRLFLTGQIDSQRAAQGIAQSFAVGGIGGLSRAGSALAVTATQNLIGQAEDALARLPPYNR